MKVIISESILGQDLKEINVFVDSVEDYQSNHYSTYDRNLLVNSYRDLPTWFKVAIKPNTVRNLYRGCDGILPKAAISFTNNKGYADTFGTYTIPFSELKQYSGLIDTGKLIMVLRKLNINSEIGDDENEVIVLNPIFKDTLNNRLSGFKNYN